MEIIFLILGIVLIIVGIAGCVIPVIPGPIISYTALLALQFGVNPVFTSDFLVMWAFIVIAVTALDYVIPIWGTKKFGGSKAGVWGSIIGLILGIFAGPFGIIIGPFFGALVGELVVGKPFEKALKAAFGSFIGFLGGTGIKLVTAGVISYHFFTNISL